MATALDQALLDRAATQRVNDAGARASLPGVGAPGSTADTDRQNLSVAAAMDRADASRVNGAWSGTMPSAQIDREELIDQAITQRRLLISQGKDPDAPARYIDPRRRKELAIEMANITEMQHRQRAFAADQAATLYKQTRDIESADDVGGLLDDLSRVKSEPGTLEHDRELAQIGLKHTLGIETKTGSEIFKRHLTLHDKAAERRQALADIVKPPAPGLQIESGTRDEEGKVQTKFAVPKPLEIDNTFESFEEAQKFNPTMRWRQNSQGRWYSVGSTDTTEPLPAGVATQYAQLQGELAKHRSQSEKQEKENRAAAKADVPYNESDDLRRVEAEIATLERAYPQLRPTDAPKKVVVTKDGKKFNLPATQLEAALAAGYTQAE